MNNKLSPLSSFKRAATTVALFGIVFTSMANAALVNRGNGLVYDDVLNVTWLQNTSCTATELSDARRDAIISGVGNVAGHALVATDFQSSAGNYTGKMSWWGASAWAQELSYGGYSDWRLATINATSPTSTIHNCNNGGAVLCATSGNELGYMYKFNLGGVGDDKLGDQTSAFGAVNINNIQPIYWSRTTFSQQSSIFFVYGLTPLDEGVSGDQRQPVLGLGCA